MVAYLDEVKAMSTKIRDFKICQISQEENMKADALANLASTFKFISNRSIPLKLLSNPSINIVKIICQVVADPTRMDDIIAYLQDGTLPSESSKHTGSIIEQPDFALSKESCIKDPSWDHY